MAEKRKIKNLTPEELAYLAGFLEGDGSFLTQLVKGKTYKYKYTIRVSIVFFQKKNRRWFFLGLKKKIGIGTLRDRPDGICEYALVGMTPVKEFLERLMPYLVLKKDLAILILRIIEGYRCVQTEADFVEVCKLVDKTAELTHSKRRTITALIVKEALALPVETVENQENFPIVTKSS
jgi:LAGLIDADG endonuclease